MKAQMFFFLLVFSAFAVQAQKQERFTQSVIVEIEGMACQEGCADAIDKNLEALEGVVSSLVSFEDKRAIITYDPNIIATSDLENTIVNTKVKSYAYSVVSIKNVVE